MTTRQQDFTRAADPYRRELLAYCYRMSGSPHEAEDLVQETYLNAWRAYEGFEGRSSLRTWLYRIATTTCLKALERRSRRALPSGLTGPSSDPAAALDPRRIDAAWLEPIPDALLDPATTVESRQQTRLAFIAALQHLPGRQRAVLLLRDVLSFRADEVARLLDTTTAAVNSALQRARTQVAKAAPAADELAEPSDPRQQELLDAYAKAFENADIAALLRVLTEDAVLEMPPVPTWFRGRDDVCRFLATRLDRTGALRLVPTAANGQPAYAVYARDDGGIHRPHALQLLTLTKSGIARIDMFHTPELFPTFNLPT